MKNRTGSRPTAFLLVALLVGTLLSGGCSSFINRPQLDPTVTYLLQFPEKQAFTSTPGTGTCLTLLVNQPHAAPGFESSRIVYVQKPYRMDYYARHRWADSPAHMLRPILIRALDRSGLFHSVVAAPAPVTGDLRLDSELLRLAQVFEGNGSSVQLQMRVVLFDQVHQGVMASHILSVTEPAPEDTPYGGVVAANRAVSRLLPEIVAFVGSGLHHGASRCPAADRAAGGTSTPVH